MGPYVLDPVVIPVPARSCRVGEGAAERLGVADCEPPDDGMDVGVSIGPPVPPQAVRASTKARTAVLRANRCHPPIRGMESVCPIGTRA
jgi:hypothetical protein